MLASNCVSALECMALQKQLGGAVPPQYLHSLVRMVNQKGLSQRIYVELQSEEGTC